MLASIPEPTLIFLAFVGHAFDDLIEDRTLDVETRAGAAALSVIEEDGAGRAGDCAIEIGILEDYVWRLAAEFERDLLEVAGRGVNDELADFGRSGEGDLVDLVVRGERGAGGFSVAGNDVDDAIGKSGFAESDRPDAARRAAFARRA